MATPLAWRNLTHNWLRTSVGVAGVGFASMLIFMQMGFRGAIEKTSTQIYDALEFDLLLRSPAYLHLTEPRSFPEHRLLQALALPEVTAARPLNIALSEWQTPRRDDAPTAAAVAEASSGTLLDQPAPPAGLAGPGAALAGEEEGVGMGRGIIVLGVEPRDPPFAKDRPSLNAAAAKLTSSRFVLIDSKTKPEYGPQNGKAFSEDDIGVQTALGPNRVRVEGLFELGTGMVANGASMTNQAGFQAACPFHPRGETNVGLVELAEGVDAEAAAAALRAAFAGAEDIQVLTRDQVNEYEKTHWMQGTPFGAIFTLGVAVSICVGIAIVYQVLSTDIANLLSEYATLKAIGYGNNYLSSVVLRQSLLLAIVSYAASLIVAAVLYYLIKASAGIPMELSPTILIAVFLLTVGMCLLSGSAALRKLFTADPASLF